MSKTTKALAIMGVVAGLGVAALPMSSYAATDQTNMGVKTTIDDYIAIETTMDGSTDDKYVEVKDTANTEGNGHIMNNGPIGEGTGIFNVKTNNKHGYYVQIKATDLTMKNAANDTIDAGVPAQNKSAWGYKASAAEGATNVTIADGAKDYAAVTASGVTIATGAAATSNDGDNINVTFGVSADAQQAAGEYKGTVILTATSGPAA